MVIQSKLEVVEVRWSNSVLNMLLVKLHEPLYMFRQVVRF